MTSSSSFVSLTAISPLDGRYAKKLQNLTTLCSEFGLMRLRLSVEIAWFKALASETKISELPKLSKKNILFLDKLLKNFSEKDAEHIKNLEKRTNHDLKALEYFLKSKISQNAELKPYQEFIHFACTSDDINNIAYALMLKNICEQQLLPTLQKIERTLTSGAKKYAGVAMLGRTHGQIATPTTFGKEFANFAARLKYLSQNLKNLPIFAKANGAVGNFNTHRVTYPKINWLNFSKKFIEDFGLKYNSYTTQIEPHDNLALFCNILALINTVLLDMARDIWGYISLNYLQQKTVPHETGSSVMPHKINPIDFENAEGNLGVANALLRHFSEKLPISRFQRDLSDSTVMRNLGVGFGHSLLAYQMLLQGLEKIVPNQKLLQEELENHYEVLTEAIQTTMRRFGVKEPYEKLKAFARGKKITQEILHEFIIKTPLPKDAKESLLKLTPENYLGYAKELALLNIT